MAFGPSAQSRIFLVKLKLFKTLSVSGSLALQRAMVRRRRSKPENGISGLNAMFKQSNRSWRQAMNHRGIEYTVTATSVPGVWKWQFRIGDEVKTGKTETRINLLAIRRVQLRIDRELKKMERELEN
jgi:hypothetical protein